MNNAVKIPFLDLVTPHLELEAELVSIFRSILRSSQFVGGEVVEEFEQEFAQFCGVQHCVGVGSGTDALRFALIAAGVQSGDTVITVPNTFIATTEAISQAGAWPDFVDIDERSYCMDPRKLREYLEMRCHIDRGTGKLLNRETLRHVTAIVPVHLYGEMADMDPILECAKRYNLMVIEDACQAHGAEYLCNNRWRRAGSLGLAAAFSFYPGKNLGACGEAGAVTTNDPLLADRVRMLREHGQREKYHHQMEGYNGRLDAIQAGLLFAKLKYLQEWNEKRRGNARRYDELLRSVASVTYPYESPRTKSSHHLYVIRTKNRGELQAHLTRASIGTQIHYPIPLHLQKAYESLGHKAGDFPVAERAAEEILSLPMYPHLEYRQQQRIASEIQNWALIRRSQDKNPLPAARATLPGLISRPPRMDN
jgi:dTDP-4-amino-4,6-dideoxygalactose transaminase